MKVTGWTVAKMAKANRLINTGSSIGANGNKTNAKVSVNLNWMTETITKEISKKVSRMVRALSTLRMAINTKAIT